INIFLILFTTFANAAPPSPPFLQCPSVGQNTSCAILLYIDPHGSLRVLQDPSQGPYDGIEDTLVGVQNDSTQTITSIPLSSPLPIFGFDDDGICGADPNTGNPYNPAPAGCPFGPTTYEGPNVSFSGISSGENSGIVNFINGLSSGGSTYFSLEERI